MFCICPTAPHNLPLDVHSLDVDLYVRPPVSQVRAHIEGTPPSSSALAFQATWESLISRIVSIASLGAPVVSVLPEESHSKFGHETPLNKLRKQEHRETNIWRDARGDSLSDTLAPLSTPNAIRSEVHGPPFWPSDIEM